MCALIRELVVPISDLGRLSIQCTACQTEVTVDLQGKDVRVLAFCPACHANLDEKFRDQIDRLARLLAALEVPTFTLGFRVPPPA